MKILKHEQRGAVWRRQGIQRPNGRQRVLAAGLGSADRLAGNLEALFDVASGQPQFSSWLNLPISAVASSCSWDVIQMPGKTGPDVFG